MKSSNDLWKEKLAGHLPPVLGEEIDIFELKCENNDRIHVDVHCPSGCARGYRKTPLSFGRAIPPTRSTAAGARR